MEQYRTELSLLKASLWGQTRFPVETEENGDWGKVFQELKDQAVAGVAADALGAVPGVDPLVKRSWIQFVIQRMGFWNKLMKEQDGLKTLLDREEIPFVILKGAAAAMYYSQPESRAMGDVDIIVKPADFDRTDRILRENGYSWLGAENDRHNEYTKNGIQYELHRYFSTFKDVKKAKVLDDLIYAGIDRRSCVTVGPYSVPVLPPLENGLVLLAHIDHHMEGGLGLRQIIDWMLYVDRVLDDRFWEDSFGPLAARLGMDTLAVTVTRMCQLYLGLGEDKANWCLSADEGLCRDLMDATIARGNFGMKLGSSTATIPILSAMSNFWNIPRFLQTRGCANWKALKKYPFLRPFAWLYQICRYIRKGLSPEYSVGQLVKDVRQVKPNQKLTEQLGIQREKKSLETPRE